MRDTSQGKGARLKREKESVKSRRKMKVKSDIMYWNIALPLLMSCCYILVLTFHSLNYSAVLPEMSLPLRTQNDGQPGKWISYFCPYVSRINSERRYYMAC